MINCYSIIVPINAYPCALSGVQQIYKKKYIIISFLILLIDVNIVH